MTKLLNILFITFFAFLFLFNLNQKFKNSGQATKFSNLFSIGINAHADGETTMQECQELWCPCEGLSCGAICDGINLTFYWYFPRWICS